METAIKGPVCALSRSSLYLVPRTNLMRKFFNVLLLRMSQVPKLRVLGRKTLSLPLQSVSRHNNHTKLRVP